MIASIVIPATFQGSLYLIVLWVLMGLAGLSLILTSAPVKRPLIAALRRELEVPDARPLGRDAQQPAVNLRLAISEVSEELEAVQGILSGPKTATYFVDHELPTAKWGQFGAVIAAADPALHKRVRAAYRDIDALNKTGIRRGLRTRSGPTTNVDSTLVRKAQESAESAISLLGGYFAP